MSGLKDKIGAVAEKVRRKPQPVEIEQSLERLSHVLDGVFRIPGTGWRFGLDSILGLVPGVGDVLTSAASFYILAAGVRYRVPKITLLRMALNIAVDYIVGLVPILGDAFDFVWKSNERNIALMRKRATVTSPEEARKGRKSDWIFVGLVILVLIGMLVGTIMIGVWVLTWILNKIFY